MATNHYSIQQILNAVYDETTGGLKMSGSISGAITLNDDVVLGFGTGAPADLLWETADANANALLLALPSGGAVDVPVFIIADQSALNMDLGFFNGITEPTLAILDSSATKYVKLAWDGTYFTFNSDAVSSQFQFARPVAFNSTTVVNNDNNLQIGAGTSLNIRKNTVGDDCIYFGFDEQLAFVFTEIGNVALDFGKGSPSHPIVYFTSATAFGTSTAQWGALQHDSTQFNITSGLGKIRILPVAGSITQIGDAGSTSQGLAANDDLFVTGKLEVDSQAFFDSTCLHSGTTTLNTSVDLAFGTSANVRLDFSGNQATSNCLVLALDSTSKDFVITHVTNKDKDHDHAASTNPTVFIHSATDPDTANTQWISLTHDATNGVISTGTGDLHLTPSGNVRFGTHSAIGIETVTGYITMKDSGGTSRKIAVVS